eukprot:CAMPEP_0116109550 /NCGR_PEP_ID=MMETSP0327-20121206/17391_1 /TAXON_ID=44447 /ORGANISM="Pseudo-nitzschia delicatissima, Strain B596" /LENGTH=183 /DNA_ID=CAMNT_0003602561 /DNA_START=716 /DNA_END=1267 /DNA_ORIENTATION=+
MIGSILKICLVVLLTNPIGVVGINFPGLTSFGGLRGAQKEAENTNEETVPESISELNSLDEENDLEWKEFLENEMEESSDEDYDEGEMDMESLGDEFEDDMETQEERELHPANYYHYNHGYNYNRRGHNYYSGPAYYSNNYYGPYHNGYYSYYNNFNHYHGNGYYNGYRRRRPGYYAYNNFYV